MKRAACAAISLAVTICGCGSTAARTSTASPATADAASSATKLITSTGANQFAATGSTRVTGAHCYGTAAALSCLMTYEFTAPNGKRNELQMSVPVGVLVTNVSPAANERARGQMG